MQKYNAKLTPLIPGVSNFTHGTGFLDANGFTHYTPEANYYGAAQFNYSIKAVTGQTASATVNLNIQNVNDAPTARGRFGEAANDGVFEGRRVA